MQRIYLDHNATTPVDPAVLEAMLPFLSADFGNASSIHAFGQRARAAVETAREQVAALIRAHPQEIVFTSGGTESDNQAIFGVAQALAPTRPGAHVITSSIEHEAVLNSCQALGESGIAVTYLPPTHDGAIDPKLHREAVRRETVLISVMYANNELGTIQNIEMLGQVAREHNIVFHTDAVQAVGKIPVDVSSLPVDLLAISGHKLYAPKGVGALYIKRATPLRQLLYGGHHQRGFRPGTENVAGIVALGKAAELARLRLNEDSIRLAALRDRLEQGLRTRIPDCRVNGAGAERRLPNTSNITFAGIEGEALVIALDLRGLACSTGAACSSGAVEPSHVLTAIGLPAAQARATLRFSLGRPTTADEIDAALEMVPAAVSQLRALSPTYPRESSAHH